jgi:class 3 adenylate cyclase
LGPDARLLLLIAASGAAAGLVIGAVRARTLAPGLLGLSLLKGLLTGGLVSVATGGLEQIVLRRLWRALPLGAAILVRTVLYTPLVIALFLGISVAFRRWPPMEWQLPMLGTVLGVTAGALLFGTTLVALLRLLGGRVILNLLSGRYHRPFEEERIFLFLDLVGSTTLAERLGALRFHRLLDDFYSDLAEPIRAAGGEVHAYVGDEVIVTWPIRDRRRNGRCLECHFDMVAALAARRPRYEREYGLCPAFRVGIHGGTVVAGEVGQHRRQVVFLGDVVNTASRVQAECKARERDLLVTRDLLDRLDLPPGLEAHSLGGVRLRGKEREVELCEVRERPAP